MSARGTTVPVILLVVLVAATLAGCVDGPGATGQIGDEAPEDPVAQTRFEDLEAAKAADGPTLEPTDADSRVRAKLIAPAGFQALPIGPSEFVVLVWSQKTQEPVLGATVTVETDRGESARLAEDGHGVYVGDLELTATGETAARITVESNRTTLVFPLEVASYAAASDLDGVDALVYEPYLGDQELRMKLLSPDEPVALPEPGPRPFTFQLLDGDGDPLEDVEARLKSWMPPHGLAGGEKMPGHGTHTEVDPVHHRLGIYQGQHNPVMGGGWWTDVILTVDGTKTVFRVTVDVHKDELTPFTEALAADGPETNLTGGPEGLTAKLLVPEAESAPQGNQTVRVLLHRLEAGRPAPVIDGDVDLEVEKQGEDGRTVEGYASAVHHANSGTWTAQVNLTEQGTWSLRVTVEDRGSVASGELLVQVG